MSPTRISLWNQMTQSRLRYSLSPRELQVSASPARLTIGLPKAVMLSHRNIVSAALQFHDIDGRYLSHRDVFCGVLPFYHIGYSSKLPSLISSGLNFTLLISMVIGLKVVVMRRFELEKWLQTVQKHSVTFAHVAPPIS